jgi:hypothetical protein
MNRKLVACGTFEACFSSLVYEQDVSIDYICEESDEFETGDFR